MPRGRAKPLLVLTGEERETLERWARRPTTAQALAQRARIVLRCATGQPNQVVARDVGVTRLTVGRWRQRFVTKRLDGLLDEPRPGAPRKITDGEAVRPEPDGGQPDLARLRVAAASGEDVQALEGSAVY